MNKKAFLVLIFSALTSLAQNPEMGPTSGGTVRRFQFLDGNGFHGTVTAPTTKPTLSLTFDFLQLKSSVVAASSGSNVTLSGTQTLDGYTTNVNDRILVKDQTNATQNGIYVAAAGAWARSSDANSGNELVNASVVVTSGTINAGSTWQCNTPAPITIGVTAITFVQTAAPAGAYALGAGTLSVSSVNNHAIANHTHAINSNSNPGTSASILATDANGYLQLVRLGIGTTPTQPLDVNGNVFIDNTLANLFMKDTSTGLQSSVTEIINPQSGNAIRTNSFASGIRGWNISDNGDAEFNNMLIRGELRASVFRINEITATAGTFGVFFSASTLANDCTTPTIGNPFNFDAKNSDAGGSLFAVNDIVRFKTWTGTGVGDSWALVTAFVPNGSITTYTATLESGSQAVTFHAGSAIVDYGPAGTGFITESADGTIGSSPNLTMATHSGSPWSSQQLLLRLGNLNGSYGYASNVYGLGIGSYGVAGQSWETFDTTNGIKIGNNVSTIGQWDVNGKLTLGLVTTGSPNITIDTTNGIVLRNNTTNLFQVDTFGNVTMGNVATNQGNAFFNNSNNRLEMRGGTNGTTVEAYIDQDGAISAGGSPPQVKINHTGIAIVSPTVFGQANAITWTAGGVTKGDVYNTNNAGASLSALEAFTTNGNGAQVNVNAQDGAHSTQLQINSTGAFGFGALFSDGTTTFQGLNIGGTGSPTPYMVKVNGIPWFLNSPVVATSHTPSSSSDTGTQGTIAWDANFIYVCVATNTWKRVAISTW